MRAPNVFGGNPFTPKEGNPFAMLEQFKMMNPEPPPVMQQIGNQLAEPQQPMNTRFIDDIRPIDQARLDLARESLRSKEGIESGKLDINKQKVGISQQRADVYDFKAKNPNSKIITPGDGKVYAIDPITNEKTDLGIDTYSESEKNQLGIDRDTTKITNTGAEARKTEELRQKGRESLEEVKARHTRELEEYKSGIPSKSADLPTQQSKSFQVNYNKLINSRPDLRKFVKLDEAGMPIINKVGQGGLTQIDRDYINKSIFGKPSKDVNLPVEGGAETKPVAKPNSTTKETPEQRMARLKAAAGVK